MVVFTAAVVMERRLIPSKQFLIFLIKRKISNGNVAERLMAPILKIGRVNPSVVQIHSFPPSGLVPVKTL